MVGFFTFGRYGALLESFIGRQDLVERIKGCIIDSGGADPLDTKVCSLFHVTNSFKCYSMVSPLLQDLVLEVEMSILL